MYEPSKRRLTWPNGALATLYNAVEPDQLRGPQHSLAWCDELAKWRYAQETWDMLQFGLRLGARPQAIIATTPRPIPVLKQIIRQPGTVITRGTTFENRSNLAESFLSQVVSRYEGTRLGRQELSAEILDDIPGALWTRAVIDGRERLANCRKCRELSLRSILQVRADQDALPRRTADEAKDPASIATQFASRLLLSKRVGPEAPLRSRRQHNVMRHQDVGPRLAAILLNVVIGSFHPFRGGAGFCLYDWIIHLVRGLDLDDQLLASRLDHEIRFV